MTESPYLYAGGFALNFTGLEVAIYVCAAFVILAVLAFPIVSIARSSKPPEKE